jgi:hypothetical protein
VRSNSSRDASSPAKSSQASTRVERWALLLVAIGLASCGLEGEAPQVEPIKAALASDGGTACSLEGATTAGLQGNCAAGQWCNLDTAVCQTEYLPAGAAIPLPAGKHGCSGVAAFSACSSGSCNAAKTLCGCQIDQDCPSGQACDQGSFDCSVPAGGGADAGADAADAATVTDASASEDTAGAGGSVGATDAATGDAGGTTGSAGDAAGPSSSCSDRTPCAGSEWCNSGTCEPLKATGASCSSSRQCRSSVCEGLVCRSGLVSGSGSSGGGGGGGCTYAGDPISGRAWVLVGLLIAASVWRRRPQPGRSGLFLRRRGSPPHA